MDDFTLTELFFGMCIGALLAVFLSESLRWIQKWKPFAKTRSKGVQSQCTYRRKLAEPRFQVLPEWQSKVDCD